MLENISSNAPVWKPIEQAVENALKQEVEKAAAEAVAHAKEELDRRIPEIVAGVAIAISRRVSMTRGHDLHELVIRIENGLDVKGGR